MDEDFVFYKVDMQNAFNVVSRQAVLDECSTFFPELIPWASWCYGSHPLLWHPLGQITSESGVQQGDPLGPLLFALVLHKLVASVEADDECFDLLLQAWYLDDGALAGSRPAVLRALHLIEEMGPALGLHVNLAQFIAGKCAESRKLLSGLVDVAAANLQVAVTLLRMCGSFCRMVHIARVTPPSLASDALRSFDEEVQQCFALCTAIEVPNGAWCQAQLGLKCGGLGLRSVSLHAAAAFIASLSSSGFGSADYIHLQQAVVAFNSQVSLPNAISVVSVLGSPTRTQKVLSGMIEDQLFSILLESSSHANRARLLSVAAPHSSSWLSVVPSPGLGLHLESNEYQMAIKWWLGLDTSGESCHQTGAAVLAAETRKLHSNGPKCQELGWSCIPLAVETYGNWDIEAQDTISRLASHLAIHQSSPKSSVVAEIYGRLNMTLIHSIAWPGSSHPPNCLCLCS
eukprot:Em0009g1045a